MNDSEQRFSVNLKERGIGVYVCKNASKISIQVSHSTYDAKKTKSTKKTSTMGSASTAQEAPERTAGREIKTIKKTIKINFQK